MRRDTEEYNEERDYTDPKADPKKQGQDIEDQREPEDEDQQLYEEGVYSEKLPSDGRDESDHPKEEGESEGWHHRLRDADPDTHKETDIPYGSKKKDEDRKNEK